MSETENNQPNQAAETANQASGAESKPGKPVATSTGAVVFHLDQILQKRLLATFIDLVLVGVVAAVLLFMATMFLPRLLGALFSFFVLTGAGALILVKDMPFKYGEFDSQSPGKKAMNIRVTDLQGDPITVKQSIQRNAILAMPYVVMALGSLFSIIPILGLLGTLLIVLPLLLITSGANIYEIYRIYSGERNRRWGDELAGTIVAWE